MAEIITIHIVRKRSAVAESYNCVTVRSNFGIVGDYKKILPPLIEKIKERT